MKTSAKDSEQEKLIGKHPESPNLFGEWLSVTDLPVSENRRHRALSEIEGKRQDALKAISEWLITHHASDIKKKRLRTKKEILKKHGFNEYLKRLQLFPLKDKTKKGNFAEIVLAEYLTTTSKLNLLVYRLRYNPNIDESMKGDDVVLLDAENVKRLVLVGEAKFRKTPTKDVINELVNSFDGGRKFPLSLSFIAERVAEMGNEILSEQIEELQVEMYDLKIPIVYVGFLLSNDNASKYVEKYAKPEISNLVLISLGVDEPVDIVDSSYKFAVDKIAINEE